jgi:hypothetical protein
MPSSAILTTSLPEERYADNQKMITSLSGVVMKIYLFNPESGIYEGEDFSDEQIRPGAETLPPHATTVAPPPYRPGQVPVFQSARQSWELMRLAAARTAVRQADPTTAAPGPREGTCQLGSAKLRSLLTIVAAALLLFTAPLYAVSYPPSGEEPTYLKDQESIKVGAKLHLFHSGTQEARSAIKVGDVLTVYREYPPDISGLSKESGKVRITGTLGEYYFEAEVIEGHAYPGYLAVKDSVACLVTTRIKARH